MCVFGMELYLNWFYWYRWKFVLIYFHKTIFVLKMLSPDELIYFIYRISGGNFDNTLQLVDNLKIFDEKLADLFKFL